MYNALKGKITIYRAIHHRANLTRTFKTEYQPPIGGTIQQEILKTDFLLFLCLMRREYTDFTL